MRKLIHTEDFDINGLLVLKNITIMIKAQELFKVKED